MFKTKFSLFIYIIYFLIILCILISEYSMQNNTTLVLCLMLSARTCHVCGHVFGTKSGLNEHLLRHHSDRGARYKCDTCGKAYMSKTLFKSHIMLHAQV